GPGHGHDRAVQRVLVGAVELRQRPEHAAGQARPHDRALRVGERALRVDARDGGGGAGAAQRRQLVGEQVLQALAAAREELHGASDSSRPAKSAADSATCADRRWPSSTSSRRLRRGPAQATTSAAGMSSSSQPWMIAVGTSAAWSGCALARLTGGAIRNSARTGTSSDARPEIHAPRLDPARTSGPAAARADARAWRWARRPATSPWRPASLRASKAV